MSELLKDKYYNYNTIRNLGLSIKDVYDLFQVDNFVDSILDETWDELGLKARMRKITINLGEYLPREYEQALRIIDEVIASYPLGFNDFALMCFPDFVEVFGQDECYLELSIDALKRYTCSSSSEFAVRPFIVKHERLMMMQMKAWAKHENDHVRRLSSEGCRPRLPWGQALNSFKKDPSPVLDILDQLKADPSLYVRKSVANNLNDISKSHPNLVADIAKDWYGQHKYTDWIVKHGCRTLLKKGNPEILALFGYNDSNQVDVDDFDLGDAFISMGEYLTFSFAISVKVTTKIRLEYGIDFVKANKKHNRKIFQISEISLKPNQKKMYTKKHSFADLSTRKHYPGIHSITLIVNGAERGTLNFMVLEAQ